MKHFHATTLRLPSPTTVVAFLALFLAMGGGGYFAFAKSEKKTSGKFYDATRFLGHPDQGFADIGFGSKTCTSSASLEGTGSFNAGVDLPDGARITRVTFYYVDSDPDDDMSFELLGRFITEGVDGAPDGSLHLNDEIAPAASSSGASADNRTIELIPPSPYEVDNANEGLTLGVWFEECSDQGTQEGGTILLLHGARVDYELK